MSMLKLQDPIDRFGDEIPESTPRQVKVASVRVSTLEMMNLILTFVWALFLLALVPLAVAFAVKFLIVWPGGR